MSGHEARGSPRRRYSTHPLITAAVAAVMALVVAACSSGSSPAPGATNTTVTVPGTSAHSATLTGAGSTFDAPLFNVTFARYQQLHPGVTISYDVVGSSAGIAAISAQEVDFGASDSPMTARQLAAAKGGQITQVPVVLGGEAIVYNLSLGHGARLHLTGPVLAKIYLGQITRWNDPALKALNPGVSLPDAPISVVFRSDGSGTTYIFSDYLSHVDPTWKSRVGTAQKLSWPTGEGSEGNAGVTATVDRTPFSIGYIQQAYSTALKLPVADLRNQAGNYVVPTTATVAAAAAQKPHITPTDFSIVNEPGANSYPISGYSWALVYTHQQDQARGQALVAMLDWLAHSGQSYAAANGYVPLPAQIQQLATTMLRQITGPSGAPFLG